MFKVLEIEKRKRMRVIKRNGKYEKVMFDKVLRRIMNLANSSRGKLDSIENVEPDIISQKVISRIYDEITTSELDELAARLSISMGTVHPDYDILATRIIISNNHKSTPSTFSDCIKKLYSNSKNDKINPLVSDLVHNVTLTNQYELNNMINNDYDYTYDYFGFKTLEKGYLLKIDGVVIERIQYMLMRVSIGLHGYDIEAIKNTYTYLSNKYYTHATPTLYNCGTNYPQLLSCFLMGVGDSVEGMYDAIKNCALISKGAGGIGIHMGNIRGKNSYIRGTNGKSNGILPYIKVLNETAKHVNQAGRRNGSFAIYLEMWHPEIMGFLELKRNHGDENLRARDLFYAVYIPDRFMEAVRDDKDWYLMCADTCKGLYDTYGEEFNNLYDKYVAEEKYVEKIAARKIWNQILTSQIETGTPYMLYKDHINKKSNQKNIGIIRSSNLCTEIVEYSDDKEYACCTLASICLANFVKDNEFDFKQLFEVSKIVTRNLDRIIDINLYPVPETKLSNMNHRPLGIGVQGLADTFAKLRLPFTCNEAKQLNKDIFETIYYGALTASHEIALKRKNEISSINAVPYQAAEIPFTITEKEKDLPKEYCGSYSSFVGSPISEGIYQFDMWNIKPSDRWNWNELRDKIQKDGIRNSLLLAPMPTASTSQIMGFNECFEPYTSNIYKRGTLAGEFMVVNKYLVNDLVKLGKWNQQVKDKIIIDNGSVKNLDISNELKELYKTVWEIKQKDIIDMAADRGAFIDQSQSMNLFIENPDFNKLSSMHLYSWKKGLKTGIYYLRTKGAAKAQQFTIDPNTNIVSDNSQEICESCSG
jgi:ribonucleoside-diphosphate reductase alpha chain